MMAKSTWAAILVLAGERPLGWARQQLVELAGQSPRPYIIAADGGAAYLAESDICLLYTSIEEAARLANAD